MKAIVIDVDKASKMIRFYFVEDAKDLDELTSKDRTRLRSFKIVGHVRRFELNNMLHSGKLLANVLPIRYDLLTQYQNLVYRLWLDIVNAGIGMKVAE